MSKHSRSKTVWRVVLAVASVLVIVASVAVAAVYRPTWIHADSPRRNARPCLVRSAPASWKRIALHE